MQEVVLVEVGDPGSDLTGHPLELQQLSLPIAPVLLSQVTLQVALQCTYKTHPHLIKGSNKQTNKQLCAK